jgi:hypothetical protein
MRKVLGASVSILSLLILLSSCSTGTVTDTSPQGLPQSASSAQSATVSEDNFLPGEVLADLPVYPGATPTTLLNPGSGPPSFPLSSPAYVGPLRYGYQSASAQYTVQATEGDILDWYVNELGRKGYRKSDEGGSGGVERIGVRKMGFFLPSQPLVSVQVHVYDVPDAPVFEVLVTYSVPLPKSPEKALPSDIDSVEVTYFGYSESALPRVKTLTDRQAVMQLVNMVNALPVRPDYAYIGGPMSGGPQTIFSLVFHSPSKGDITVTSVLGFDETGVHVGDYPILEDVHNLLREAVEQVLDVEST